MLGIFLVSRRARLKPADFGLPIGTRRTPGLRREELAVLAGVSVSWYTWLEQGRDIRASAETLRRVSEVLKLDRVEAAHLFALSSLPVPPGEGSEQLSDGLTTLLQMINPIPAYIRNDRLDILAWNEAVAELFVDYGTLKPFERNTLRLIFLHQPYRHLIVDWANFAQGMLSTFRASRARAQDKTPFDSLASELMHASQEFREWWPDVDVKDFDEGCKCLDHPKYGRMNFTYIAMTPLGRPELSLVAYVPRKMPDDPGSDPPRI